MSTGEALGRRTSLMGRVCRPPLWRQKRNTSKLPDNQMGGVILLAVHRSAAWPGNGLLDCESLELEFLRSHLKKGKILVLPCEQAAIAART